MVDLNAQDINNEGYLEKEIPNVIYKYICEVIENYEYLGKKIDGGQFCNLTIELFLPKEFLAKDFDLEIPDALKEKKSAIRDKYPVVLRSLDRLHRNEWRNQWNKKWARLHNVKNNEIIDFDRYFDNQNTAILILRM